MNKFVLRFAQEADAEEILRIYKPYIENTAVTFECETPPIAEFRKRIMEITAEYPYLVCLADEKIVGYAYAHRQMERAAYGWNAVLSVYIDKPYHGCCIGKALYSSLLDILKLQNVQNVYGGVTSPNKNSEALHEYLGFNKLGVYHNTGYKCGAWHDVIWFEKAIDHYGQEPKPFLPVDKINTALVSDILKKNCGMIRA